MVPAFKNLEYIVLWKMNADTSVVIKTSLCFRILVWNFLKYTFKEFEKESYYCLYKSCHFGSFSDQSWLNSQLLNNLIFYYFEPESRLGLSGKDIYWLSQKLLKNGLKSTQRAWESDYSFLKEAGKLFKRQG